MSRQASELVSILLAHQRDRRLISQQLGAAENESAPGVSYVEDAILRSLSEANPLNVKELAEQIGLERSWVSRIINKLDQQNLIKVEKDPADKRSKLILLNPEGQKKIKELDEFADKILNKSLAKLSESEITELGEYLEELCNAMQISGQKHSSTNIIQYNLSRLSRSLGLFGDNILDLNINLIELYLLFLLRSDKSEELKEINEHIPYHASSISRSVTSLSKKQIINKETSPEDARAYRLILSSKGAELQKQVKNALSKVFQEAINKLDNNHIQRINQLIALTRAKSEVTFRKLSSDAKYTTYAIQQGRNQLGEIKLLNDINPNQIVKTIDFFHN